MRVLLSAPLLIVCAKSSDVGSGMFNRMELSATDDVPPKISPPTGCFSLGPWKLPPELSTMCLSDIPGLTCKLAMSSGLCADSITNPVRFVSTFAHTGEVRQRRRTKPFGRLLLFLLGYSDGLCKDEERALYRYLDGCDFGQLAWHRKVASQIVQASLGGDGNLAMVAKLLEPYGLKESAPLIFKLAPSLRVVSLGECKRPPYHVRMIVHSAVFAVNSFSGVSVSERNWFIGMLKINYPGYVARLVAEHAKLQGPVFSIFNSVALLRGFDQRWAIEYFCNKSALLQLSRTKAGRAWLVRCSKRYWNTGQSTVEFRRRIASYYVSLTYRKRRASGLLARLLSVPEAQHRALLGKKRASIQKAAVELINGIRGWTDRERAVKNLQNWAPYLVPEAELTKIVESFPRLFYQRQTRFVDTVLAVLIKGLSGAARAQLLRSLVDGPISWEGRTIVSHLWTSRDADVHAKHPKHEDVDQSLSLFVRQITGRTSTFWLQSSSTVGQLMRKLRDSQGYPLTFQRLIHQGRQLGYPDSLEHCGIKSGNTIDMAGRLGYESRASYDTFTVRVRALGRSKVEQYDLDTKAIVHDLKHLIKGRMYTPVHHQKLSFAGTILVDDTPLSQYGLRTDGQEIHLVVTPGHFGAYPVTLKISGPRGMQTSLKVNMDLTILNIKSDLQPYCGGLGWGQMGLYIDGIGELEDEKTLQHYNPDCHPVWELTLRDLRRDQAM